MSELSGNSGQLKPCPFCGKSPASQEHYDADGKLLACYVSCQNLHCSQFTFPKPLPWFKAGAWNTRPIEDELLEKLQQLRAQWESVPWDSIYQLAIDTNTLAGTPLYGAEMVRLWVLANAPHEESPTTEQLRALVELIRKA